jgi:phenylalanyl-tRNA synthetase beta chain
MKQRLLRVALNGLGYDEAINFSFIQNQDEFELIPAFAGDGGTQPELSNPILENASSMRSTLLPGLLTSVRHNNNHGIRDVRLFEIGRIFSTSKPGQLPEETNSLTMVATGGAVEEARANADRELDFFDLKGALETAVARMNLKPLSFSKADVKHLRSGQAAKVSSEDGTAVGTAGRLSEAIASAHKFRQPVYVLELDLSSLLAGPTKEVHYKPLPRYPMVVRDVSILLSRNIQLDEVLATIHDQRVSDCIGAMFVGVYEGANIPPDKRSLTIRVEYRSDERTLRDEEVEDRHAHLTQHLLQKFSAEQR